MRVSEQGGRAYELITALRTSNLPNEPLDEPVNDGDRECDRVPAGPVNGMPTTG